MFPISRLADSAPNDPPVTVQVRAGGELIVVETDHGAVRAKPGRAMGQTPPWTDRRISLVSQ